MMGCYKDPRRRAAVFGELATPRIYYLFSKELSLAPQRVSFTKMPMD
jgi:hypothetical protein